MNNPTRLVDDPFLGKDTIVGSYDNKQLRQHYNRLKTAKGYTVWVDSKDGRYTIERSYTREQCLELRKMLCRFLKRVKMEIIYHERGIRIC